MELNDVLPIVWKYYIAIMAVSCYDCIYLLKLLEEQFLLSGGEQSWLIKGLTRVPKKLQRLGEVNELMAYRPWTIGSFHIESLVKGDAKDFKDIWSYPEIIHAGSILAAYHSLCSLVLGMGLKEDSDSAMYFPKYLSECHESTKQVIEEE